MNKFLRLYLRLWQHHQIPLRSGALTYTLILGLVPLLAVCIAIFSLVVGVKQINMEFKSLLLKYLVSSAGTVVGQYIDTFLAKVQFKTIGFVGFAALLVTALLMLSSIEESINRIWNIRRKKPVWKRFLIYNVIMIFGPVCVSLSIAATTLVGKYFPHLWLKANIGAVLINTLFVTLTYKIFPNKRVSWVAASLSGAAVALVCEIAKWGYAGYTTKTLFYNKVYGGLAVLPLFLVWIYVNWMIFLSGALLCFLVQHKEMYRTRGTDR